MGAEAALVMWRCDSDPRNHVLSVIVMTLGEGHARLGQARPRSVRTLAQSARRCRHVAARCLAAAATGLTLVARARRTTTHVAIATALGANQRQLGAFVWAEAVITTGAGLAGGSIAAWALANMLVKVLRGVFDPAPEALAVPWAYLVAVTTIALAATVAASIVAIRSARTPHVELLRSL